ncbi:MAG: hypothetical protein AAAC47_17750 [Pararhizobium sp.]
MKKPLDPDKPLSENPAPLVDEALANNSCALCTMPWLFHLEYQPGRN